MYYILVGTIAFCAGFIMAWARHKREMAKLHRIAVGFRKGAQVARQRQAAAIERADRAIERADQVLRREPASKRPA